MQNEHPEHTYTVRGAYIREGGGGWGGLKTGEVFNVGFYGIIL